jgi:hypothetical protein
MGLSEARGEKIIYGKNLKSKISVHSPLITVTPDQFESRVVH